MSVNFSSLQTGHETYVLCGTLSSDQNHVSEGYACPRDLVPLAIYELRKYHEGIFNILLVRSGCCTQDTVLGMPQRKMRNESTYVVVLSRDVRRYRSDTLRTNLGD